MTDADRKALGILAGLAAGALVYRRESRPPDCAGIAGQTLLQAIAGAEQHPLEDFIEGLLGWASLSVSGTTLGAVHPQWAADFYVWWHGLSDAQKAAVHAAASNGADACAALETAKQLAAGSGALVSAVVVGVLAYFVVPLVMEEVA